MAGRARRPAPRAFGARRHGPDRAAAPAAPRDGPPRAAVIYWKNQ